MQEKTEISASVLNADFRKLKQWLPELEEAKTERIQFDIMDNKYVPNKGVEKSMVGKLRPETKMLFESHMMVENPEAHVKEFAEMGSDIFIFHAETAKNPFGLIRAIKDAGMEAGIAVNNRVPAEKIFSFLPKAGLALVMGVEAGFGGQSFNPEALGKISALRRKIDAEGLACTIEIDGGINRDTGAKCAEAGAGILVAGTFLFRHPKGIKEAVKELKECNKQ